MNMNECEFILYHYRQSICVSFYEIVIGVEILKLKCRYKWKYKDNEASIAFAT